MPYFLIYCALQRRLQMKIINTYPDIILLCDKMDGIFRMELWENYGAGISQELPDKLKEDSSGYDFNSQMLPVLTQVINNRDALKQARDAFTATTTDIEKRFRQVLKTTLEVDIIFYLGLCNGAGWATTLDGRNAILLGVEKIIELDWHNRKNMEGLIYHELGHILHNVKGFVPCEPLEPPAKSIWQLYSEGIAMYCEQLLCGDFGAYHQNTDDWLDWCVSNKKEVLGEYKKRVRSGESVQDFFGDWEQWRGRSNLGYFLGCEFVKSLARRYDLNRLLNLNLFEIEQEFDKFII